MKTLVVPDVHGRYDLVRLLLVEAGVPLHPAERAAANLRSVHLGDLANCVAASAVDDQIALSRALEWFDVVLVGNHEYPALGGGGFFGYFDNPATTAALNKLDRAGILRPCLLCDDVLLTHAGVAAAWGYRTAGEANAAILAAWESDRLGAPLIAACAAARGGSAPVGGVLWSDWSERRAPFTQLHGHTPNPNGPAVGHHPNGCVVVNLDVAANRTDRLVGMWLDDAWDGVTPYDQFVQIQK